MKKLTFRILLIFSSLILLMCSDNSVLESNKNIILISHVSNGCYSQNLLNKENTGPILDWKFNGNMLAFSLLFETHCSALCRDSIFTQDDLLEIFIADTNDYASRCTCQYKEDFYFTVREHSELNIRFYYRVYSKDEYDLLVDEVIRIK